MVFPEEYANHLIGAGGLVIHDGNVLLVKLLYGPAKGKWLIPGGYLEKGETLNEGVEREVLEETGLQVNAVGVLGVRSMQHPRGLLTDLYCLLRCDLQSDPTEIKKQTEEVEDVSWIELSSIPENEEVHAFTKYLLKCILEKQPMQQDLKHNEFMKKALNLSKYEQYWVN